LNIALSDGDVNSISNCLKHNITLQELTMVHTKINDNGALLITEAIQVNTTLLVLDISYNQITYKGAVAISDSLRHNSQLLELNISYNYVTLEGIKYLAECIKTNLTLLEVHMIQCFETRPRKLWSNSSNTSLATGNDLLTNSFSDTRRIFLVAIESNQLRQKLTIERTILSDNEILAIANCLQSNKVLQYFNLSGGGRISFGNEGQRKMTHFIGDSTEFDSYKRKREERMDRAITNNKKLSKIIKPIKENRTLKTLIITKYRIGDEGAAIISDCITQHFNKRAELVT